MVARAASLVSDLLETDQIGLQVFDNLDDPLQALEAVAAADALMNVIAK